MDKGPQGLLKACGNGARYARGQGQFGWALVAGLALLLGLGCFGRSSNCAPTPLLVSPGALNIPAGGGGFATVTVSRVGSSGDWLLSLDGAPAGVVAEGSIPASAQTGLLAIRVDRSVAPQSLDGLRVKGVSGGETRAGSFRLVVAPGLPVGLIGTDLVAAGGGPQQGGTMQNTPVLQEPVRVLSAKDSTGQTELRHGYDPEAIDH